MAATTQIIITDDLDGSEGASTVRFGFEDQHYEIDLTEEHRNELAELLATYIDKARPSKPQKPQKQRTDTTKIRAWAQENGYNISARGRLTNDVIEAYRTKTPASENPKFNGSEQPQTEQSSPAEQG